MCANHPACVYTAGVVAFLAGGTACAVLTTSRKRKREVRSQVPNFFGSLWFAEFPAAAARNYRGFQIRRQRATQCQRWLLSLMQPPRSTRRRRSGDYHGGSAAKPPRRVLAVSSVFVCRLSSSDVSHRLSSVAICCLVVGFARTLPQVKSESEVPITDKKKQ